MDASTLLVWLALFLELDAVPDFALPPDFRFNDTPVLAVSDGEFPDAFFAASVFFSAAGLVSFGSGLPLEGLSGLGFDTKTDRTSLGWFPLKNFDEIALEQAIFSRDI